MARQVHLLYVRVPAAYDYEKDMPSSSGLHGLYPRKTPLPPPPTRVQWSISLKGIDDANTEIV